jgi:hypothetical protein
MARTLGEVVAAAHRRKRIAEGQRLLAEEQKSIAAEILAEEQKRIAVEKWLRLEKTKRVMELDRNLIAIVVVITALPIIAALVWMLAALAMQ